MRHTRAIAGALLLAALLSCNAGMADGSCPTHADLTAFLAGSFPQAATVTMRSGDARLFMAALAAAISMRPPPADEIVIVDAVPGTLQPRILLIEKGCLIRIGALSRRLTGLLLNIVSRNGA
jgi:hypothetical protein